PVPRQHVEGEARRQGVRRLFAQRRDGERGRRLLAARAARRRRLHAARVGRAGPRRSARAPYGEDRAGAVEAHARGPLAGLFFGKAENRAGDAPRAGLTAEETPPRALPV